MQPVREIPIQTLSVAGKFPSRKNRRTVSYESQLELAFLYHLEFSPKVAGYTEQPCRVKSPSGRFYIPDFLVFFADRSRKPLLVEIKYLDDLKQNADKLLIKLNTLRDFACKKGWEFKLFTDRELLTEKLKNYEFLYGYLFPPATGSVQSELAQDVVNLVEKSQPIRVIDIAAALGGDNLTMRGIYLSAVWHLTAASVLWVNLDKKLTNFSLVYTSKPDEVVEKCLL